MTGSLSVKNLLQVHIHIHATVEEMKQAYHQIQSRHLEQECLTKPKLRTFIQFNDFESIATYITLPLSYFQRRAVAKLRLGCLPLRVETGRYQVPRLPEDERTCPLCPSNEPNHSIENEFHFMFSCTAYKNERETWLSKLKLPNNFHERSIPDKFKIVLNEALNIKHTANFLITAFNLRSKEINSQTL